MLVVGTASVMSTDGAKQAGLVGCSDIYLSKLHPVAIFFKVENLCANLYIIYSSGDVLFCCCNVVSYYACCQQVAIILRIGPDWAYFYLKNIEIVFY